MKPVFKSLVIAGLLATAGFAAFSQGTGPMGDHRSMAGDGGMMQHEGKDHMGRMDPSKRDAMLAKRSADLRAKLKITASQEGAWTAFTTAMKPSDSMKSQHLDRAEMDKLTTPERIDKMHSLRAQHLTDMTAAMDKRDEATKTFYAQLSAEQKTTFDSEYARMGHRHGGERGWKDGAKDGKNAATPSATKPKQ
jgi:hypothetical protein